MTKLHRSQESRIRVWGAGALLVLVPTLLTAAAALAAPPQAGPPEVEVEVVPASVEIPAQGEAEALVVVRNPVTETLRNVQFSWFTDAGVNVTVKAPTPTDLIPYGTLAWTLRISQKGEEPATGTLHLRFDYTWQGEGGEVPLVATGTLGVKARKPEAIEQIARVRAETALSSLMEYHPGEVYLVVTNVSAAPIQVTQILTGGPGFITFGLPDLGAGMTLASQETHTFPIKVEATGPIQPGKHLLLFEVGFKWEKAGRAGIGSIVTTHPIEAGVLGETEILTVLGVPSFLVLPGFLMMISLGLLWRWIAPRTEFPYTAKTQEFWFFAIMLSVLAALVYPWITAGRNYLEGYRLNDIAQVWFGSTIFMVVLYSVAAGALSLRWLILERRLRQRIPSETDPPIVILHKLHKQKIGIQPDRADVTINGEDHSVYLLEPLRGDCETTWVGPGILIRWSDELKAADRELQRQVEQQLTPEGDALALAELLEQGVERGILVVDWNRKGQLDGPCQVKTADLNNIRFKQDLIVEQE